MTLRAAAEPKWSLKLLVVVSPALCFDTVLLFCLGINMLAMVLFFDGSVAVFGLACGAGCLVLALVSSFATSMLYEWYFAFL